MKRPLSRKEIHAQSNALRNLEAWERARDFANRVYGPLAHSILVDGIFIEPDPMSVKFRHKAIIETWSVLDKQGLPLEADLALDFWQPHLRQIQWALARGTARDTVQAIIQGEIENALLAEEELYDFDHPPTLPLHTLYVEEEEANGQQNPTQAASECGEIDWETRFAITGVARGDLKKCGFTASEIASLTNLNMIQIAGTMADAYLAGRYWIDLQIVAQSLLERG